MVRSDRAGGGVLVATSLLVAACAAGTGGDAADLALPGDSIVFPGDSAIGDFTNGADLAESPPLAPEMVRVPAGSFRMGCNAEVDAECFPDEKPAHTVGLGAFDLDRLPTTRRDYQECITARACTPPAAEFDPVAHPDWPVNYISWQQAVDYCAYRHKRLPTEAEWEKAARGTDGRKYPWGNLPAPDCTTCNASPCARKSVEDVGIQEKGRTSTQLRLSYRDTDGQRAADLANALREHWKERTQQDISESFERSFAKLQEALDKVRTNITNIRNERARFEQDNKIDPGPAMQWNRVINGARRMSRLPALPEGDGGARRP